MGKKSKGADFVGKIPKGVWLLISLVVALILWTVLSIIPSTSRCFPNAIKVIGSIQTMVSRGLLFKDIGSSLISVLLGFLIGFVTAVPVAFLMAWYRPVRFIIEPWIQFIRNIPPLAYVPLVVIGVGVGRTPQVIVIWLATFLTMTVTIFQGVINVDETLIKAARVLGAKDSDLFVKVIFPATTPFIITAIRLGISTALPNQQVQLPVLVCVSKHYLTLMKQHQCFSTSLSSVSSVCWQRRFLNILKGS